MHPGERFNAGSHLAGLVLALAGTGWLLGSLWRDTDALAMGGAATFCAGSIALLLASVGCHGTLGRVQQAWQRVDHGATFILIAASYTPFALAAPRHALHLIVLAGLWLAAIASAARHWFSPKAQAPSLGLYLAMGWCGVLAAAPVAARLSTAALAWLAAGAVFYSIGTAFYRRGSAMPHAHGIWHLFVVAGIASHYAAVHWLLG
ncbi:MAG TPA: hemolysin III family protein [Ramlibacter sp.]|nr:hemolysin III family protein [Ramlibacter sp.]